jgi:hypothetical protein
MLKRETTDGNYYPENYMDTHSKESKPPLPTYFNNYQQWPRSIRGIIKRGHNLLQTVFHLETSLKIHE